MTSIKHTFLISISFILLLSNFALGQSKLEDFNDAQIKAYTNRVTDQVAFLEYLLNTLGSDQTNQRDKEVIIKESYEKIFVDAEVQVEDDLSEDRKVITNKDVKAYFKDVDFFFKDVKFDFEVLETEALERPKGGLYFLVTLNRTLKGTDLEGQPILNTKKRYIEINLNEATDELQIASMYTTKLNKDEALKEWWSQLSLGWKLIFKEAAQVTSYNATLADLNKIAALDSLDLSNNTLIQNIDPLSMLTDLAFLNLQNSSVKSINALSSLTDLKALNLSATAINDLHYIQYAENIEQLTIDQTQITDLSPIKHFGKLKSLSLEGTPVLSFALLAEFEQLQYLNLSDTKFSDTDAPYINALDQLATLQLTKTSITTLDNLLAPQLKELDITFTAISELQAISNHKKLEVLRISNTQIRSITDLLSLPALKRIYADNLFISGEVINDFKNQRPDVLLVVDSEELTAWWAALDINLKKKLQAYLEGSEKQSPSKEALSKLIALDSLNLSDAGIKQLFPLKRFNRLRYLDLSHNEVSSLSPLAKLTSLEELNLSHNKLISVKPLASLYKLQQLNLAANSLEVPALLMLSRLNALKRINLNDMSLQKDEVTTLVQAFDLECLIRYNDSTVLSWWNDLNPSWQQIFRVQQTMDVSPDSWQLSMLLQRNSIAIADEKLLNLNPLKQFLNLKSLYLEQLSLDDYSAIADLKQLKMLSINKMSLNSLAFLSESVQLESLNLDFTAVDNLEPLSRLEHLNTLSLAGTPIRSLKGIGDLQQLAYLNIAGTKVLFINKLEDLAHLKKLVCYNTNIWESWIDRYRQEHPDWEIIWY